MEDLFIKGSGTTPEISFKSNGIMEISGKSIPPNAATLFEPVVEWLNSYKGEKTELSFKLEYLNTSTSKALYDVLFKLKKHHVHGGFTVKWYYEEGDEDVLDTGYYYKSLLKTTFEFHEMSEYEVLSL